MSTNTATCFHCQKEFSSPKARNVHITKCPQKPPGLPAQAPTTNNPVSTNSTTPEPESEPALATTRAPIEATRAPIVATTRRNQMQSDSSDDDTTPQRCTIPLPLPIINNQAEATRMTVQKYNTVAIQYDEWLNMAKTCRSNNDLTKCVMAQLIDSNATQHKVTLLLDYLSDIMSQQKSE
jgi:hypothetical protein